MDHSLYSGRAMAQAVSRRLPTAEARVRSQGQSMWDLWWTKWHWYRFSPEYFGFPLSIAFHRCSITRKRTVFIQKLRVPQLIKNYPAFYGTWRFITVSTKACNLSLCWARLIQSKSYHHTYSVYILILYSRLHLVLEIASYLQACPQKRCTNFFSLSYM
jgi:hypothetical protein